MIWRAHWSWQFWHLSFVSHTRRERDQKVVFFTLLWNASNRRGVEAIDEWIHTRQHTCEIWKHIAVSTFSAFFPSPRVFRYATQLYTVKGKREFLQGDRSDGFCFPRILKYWNYTIRRSNLIENKGATVIYDRSDICSRRILIDLRHWSRSAVHTLKAKNPIFKSAYLYLTFSVVRSIFFGKKIALI